MSDQPDQRAVCNFRLKVGDRTLEASAVVPSGPVRVADLLPIFLSFTEAVVSAAAQSVESQGKKISCRAGCGACCRQMVPISETEARYLAALVAEMPPERQATVRLRFEQALAELERRGILDRLRDSNGVRDSAQRRKLGLEYFGLGVPCPFLEDESCSIHPHRPTACREYLVTSPAANCSHPTAETIEMVPVPLKPSQILYRFGDGAGKEAPRHVPLVLALEWEAAHRDDPQPELPAPRIFENFLEQISGGRAAEER